MLLEGGCPSCDVVERRRLSCDVVGNNIVGERTRISCDGEDTMLSWKEAGYYVTRET